MVLSSRTLWLPRIAAFALAALAAGSAVYWALQGPAAAAPSGLAVADLSPPSVNTRAVASALGAPGGAGMGGADPALAAPALASSRFALTGVVAGASQSGAALIAVDGKPPKPFVVGAVVGDGWVLRAVQARRAVLAQPDAADATVLVLDMPAPIGAKKGF
jgi:general secretion pathway protein C